MKNISKKMSEVAIEIDKLFDIFFSSKYFPSKNLVDSMKYSTISGGKKFRPYLLYVVAKKLNVDEEVALYIGACIELLHSYTLIHDDLPCMDDDDTRRGKPSNHIKFNEFTAVLTGDALQSEAFYLLSSNNLKLEAQIKIDIINLVAGVIGGRNLVSGQMLDLEFEKTGLTFKNINIINKIHNLKTAKLIVLCTLIPAIIAKKDSNYKKKLIAYAENLGMIYQIIDDLKDYENESDSMNIVNLLGLDTVECQLDEINKKSIILLKELNLEELEEINNFVMEV